MLLICNKINLEKYRSKGRSEETNNQIALKIRNDSSFWNTSAERLAGSIITGCLFIFANSVLVNCLFSNQIIPKAQTLAEVSWWEILSVLPLRPFSVCLDGFEWGKILQEKEDKWVRKIACPTVVLSKCLNSLSCLSVCLALMSLSH